jgi:hypothetical protein
MGYVYATSECFGCKKVFNYNPVKVPSIRIDGVREPVCAACIERANPRRIANGLEPVVPLPGAYDPCLEEELA